MTWVEWRGRRWRIAGGSEDGGGEPPEADGSDPELAAARARIAELEAAVGASAEVLGAADIFIGVNALDYSGYPDCRPEFIASFQQLANLATRAGTQEHRSFTIHTPLIQLSKREIIELGRAHGVDYGLTLSCYDPTPTGEACGRCDACQLRLKGFREAGIADPGRYAWPTP